MKSYSYNSGASVLITTALLLFSNQSFASIINIDIFNGQRIIGGSATYNLDMRPYLSSLSNGANSATVLFDFSDNSDPTRTQTTFAQTVNISPAGLIPDSFGNIHVGRIRLDQSRTDVITDPIESALVSSSLFPSAFSFQSNLLPSTPETRWINRPAGQTSAGGFRVENIHPDAISGSTVICHSCPIFEDYIVNRQLYRGDFQGVVNLNPQAFLANIFSNPFESVTVSSNSGSFFLRNISLVIETPELNTNSISEPGSLALLGLGLIGAIGFSRRKIRY